jgi:integrase
MPRKAEGSLRLRNGIWYARITLGPKERPAFALATCKTEDEATARRDVLAKLAEQLRATGHAEFAPGILKKAAAADEKALAELTQSVDRLSAGAKLVREGALGVGTTFADFAKKWTKGELHTLWPDHVKEKKSSQDDIYRLGRLNPIIGDVALARFTLDDAERGMRSLPEGLSSASRRQYAQLMHRVLSMAVFPARIITANPLPRGFLPNAKSTKALTYLYPSEDAQLLACKGEPAGEAQPARLGVPLCYRVLYGFLAREGMRTGEAERLRWGDIMWTDDGIGAVTLDQNKTDDPRAWTLTPGVSRALTAWRELTPHGEDEDHVFVDEDGRSLEGARLAQGFREHLMCAGTDRKQLFERSHNRRPIRAHDLRATFITVALANGKTETWVMDRTGHESSVMIARYRRAARSLAELRVGDMLPLDHAIPELTEQLKRVAKRAQISRTSGGTGRRTGFRFRRVKP